jgi:hypothetical protein
MISLMKKLLYFLLVSFASTQLHAQNKGIADSTLFDFWVGEWDASWVNADGTTSKGTNSIKKILDGKVIEENFRDPQGLKGISISVYNSANKTWHQAWADNQGGYYDFVGEIDGEKRIFRTPTKEVKGKLVTERMVFYSITPKSMMWDWELSVDGGKTWKLQWRISYKKKSS